MKKHALIIPGLLTATLLSFFPHVYAQKAAAAVKQPEIITVHGRLELEKHGETDWLILHSKDAQTYLIKGNLRDTLKKIFLDLGTKNLVRITGKKNGKYNVSCSRRSFYETNDKGENELVTKSRCYRYYYLEAVKIVSSEISEEIMPESIRDSKQEVLSQSGSPNIPRPIVGEIRGTISNLNMTLKNPIKSVEISNLDAGAPLKKILLILTPDTRILQNVPNENPMPMDNSALEIGQEVTAMYQRDENKAEALSITINKLK
ncbi:MAG: hypothetical protein PHC33_00045 [Candidatus Omnitrophica bacterium]|nr:hypothetical protein [Candidatus Omnitrophota bacterium]